MLAYLKGKIKHKSEYLIIEVNNLGYKVFVPTNILAKAKVDQDIELFAHQHVKEDTLELYGFAEYHIMRFFEELISISGVGPKTGLAVLAQFKIEEIKKSIANNDTSLLTKVSGIGKKTAERLILELKNKIDILPDKNYQAAQEVDEDAADALVSLGYTKQEALKALTNLDKKLSIEDKIKQALKNLGKSKVR